MTKIGQAYQGIWPEYPVQKPERGTPYRYPAPQNAEIRQGTVQLIVGDVVHFTNGRWCYTHELSEDWD